MASFEGQSTTGEIHGLAGEIRSSLTSEQYDLGGYTEARVTDLFHNAFRTPLTAPTEMVKFTFVVGGGKLVRSRYPEELPKWGTSALRELGFTEDRSAAETFDSQGTYKQQHDTGQNLKYLIVYPRVACADAQKSNGTETTATGNAANMNAPENIVVAAPMAIFQDMVASKVLSYAQKKKLLKLLQDKHEEFKAIEAKLVSGSQLTPIEQGIYDNNSGADEDKINWLQHEIKAMIDNGQLTAKEKSEQLKTMESNIQSLKKEIEDATTENKPKKVEKLQQKLEAIVSRKAVVEKIEPIPPKMQLSEDIIKLYLKLFPLLALEEKGRSMSLTLADLKQLEPKADLESEIKELEGACRGWFEEEEVFQERCNQVEKEAKAKYKAKKAAGGDAKKAGSSSGAKSGTVGKMPMKGSTNAWSTVTKKPGMGSSGSSTGAKKAVGTSFSALNDDDSDD